jgi:hypothetical protein
MAMGYTFSAVGAVLYALEPRHWLRLAQHGSYPLIIMGFMAGLLLIYSWIRLWFTFLVPVKANNLQTPHPAKVEDGVWPPPPTVQE